MREEEQAQPAGAGLMVGVHRQLGVAVHRQEGEARPVVAAALWRHLEGPEDPEAAE